MGKRAALLVGINEYGPNSGLKALKYAEADARSMKETLDYCRFSRVRTLLGPEATKDCIEGALKEFYDAKLELFIFYFAGHGELIPKVEMHPDVEMHCLHCFGSKGSDLKHTLALSRFAGQIRDYVDARDKLLFVDACRDRAYRGVRSTDEPVGLDPILIEKLKTLSRDLRLHEEARQRPSVFGTFLACSADQVSHEHDALRHGVFTRALYKTIRDEPRLNQTIQIVTKKTWEFCRDNKLREQVPHWSGPTFEGVNLVDEVQGENHRQDLVSRTQYHDRSAGFEEHDNHLRGWFEIPGSRSLNGTRVTAPFSKCRIVLDWKTSFPSLWTGWMEITLLRAGENREETGSWRFEKRRLGGFQKKLALTVDRLDAGKYFLTFAAKKTPGLEVHPRWESWVRIDEFAVSGIPDATFKRI